MLYRILATLVLVIMPLVYAQDCNTLCLNAGYSSGICADRCSEIVMNGSDDCALSGQAVLVIGSNAVKTYKDLDPFIGEKETNPEWIWIIKNIRTKASTNILNTSDETTQSGPLLGLKNNFIANDIDDIGIKAKKAGESFCFPNNAISKMTEPDLDIIKSASE